MQLLGISELLSHEDSCCMASWPSSAKKSPWKPYTTNLHTCSISSSLSQTPRQIRILVTKGVKLTHNRTKPVRHGDIITITILDIIYRPVFFLKHHVLETGFCLHLQVEPTELGLSGDRLALFGGPTTRWFDLWLKTPHRKGIMLRNVTKGFGAGRILWVNDRTVLQRQDEVEWSGLS
jgi:hypothetical protein